MNVSLYHCDARDVTLDDNQLMASLADDELQRANRFRFARHRRTYIVAHSLVRTILANSIGCSVHALKFDYGEAGKPMLATGPAFNLSHTGSQILFGVFEQGEIGVDIEARNDSRDLDALAQHCFSDPELAEYESASPCDRTVSFYRAWTRKEALIKALGGGLTIDLKAFSVSLADSQDNVLVDGTSIGAGGSWAIRPIRIGENVEAAVALDQRQFTVTTRRCTHELKVSEA